MSTCSLKGLLSIPRLELLACLFLSEQMEAVFDAISMQITINDIYCWSDSQIALCWIKQIQKSWKTWAENRVEKIRSSVPIDCWRCIRIQSTVGASRGISIVINIERFSDLERLLRVTAFVIRFVSN